MASFMARRGRVNRMAGESFRTGVFQFFRAITLALLLAVVAPVVYGQRAQPVQQLVFRPYHASGLYDVGDTVGWIVLRVPQRRRMHINGSSVATTKRSSKKAIST